jgi:hypothetical protein
MAGRVSLENMNITNAHIWNRSCLLWTYDNKIKTERGELIEFKDHSFLKDIYDDETPIQVTRKASQFGFSTMQIVRSYWMMRFRKTNIIYTLPTFGDVGQFVPSKVNAIIQANPILSQWTKDKDTVYQKQVGNRFIYYRGTTSGKSEREMGEAATGTMFSSDVNMHDECDRSDPTILEQYESRQKASNLKWRHYFSNPTHPQTLSQKLYEQSDQKHWFIKCEHCNHWQYLDYWRNIKDEKFVCQKCGGNISDGTRRKGQWVRKYRDKEISGYWLSHLCCPWITAKEIVHEEQNKSKAYFYNFILGLPYIGSEIAVNADMILRAIDFETNKQQHNVMGVDQGIRKHYVLMNRQGVFKVGTTDHWDYIETLIKTYDIEQCVIDGMPDITEPRKLKDKYIGKIWLSFFKKEIRSAEYIKWDRDTRTVHADRTKLIQEAIDAIATKKLRFQLKPQDLTDYVQHWKSLYKITETDSMGIERDSWESTGEDHFVFAQLYALLALRKAQPEEGGARTYTEPQNMVRFNIAPSISEVIKKNEQQTGAKLI